MSHEIDMQYARLAVQHGFMNDEQMKRCLNALNSNPNLTWEEWVLREGVLDKRCVHAVKVAHKRLMKDREKQRMSVSGYEIISRVGEGGLGVVYKARQLSMNRIVALKILHRRWVDDEEFRKRFLLEARLLGKLNHPNLITVYDVGRENWKYYFSMEFVDGRTAEEIVDANGPMETGYAVSVTIQVAKVINYLWGNNVVHCDIKPGNILISKDDIAKLGDFGFARIGLELGKGQGETVLCTPEYVSPEQAMGQKDLDFRSDIYSLGVSLFHMVTGRPPYEGSSRMILAKHVRGEVPDPRELNKDVSRNLAAVIKKMMAKRREDRYQSVEELIEDLVIARMSEDPCADESALGRTAMLAAIKKEKMLTRKYQEELKETLAKLKRSRLLLILVLVVLALSLALNVVFFTR